MQDTYCYANEAELLDLITETMKRWNDHQLGPRFLATDANGEFLVPSNRFGLNELEQAAYLRDKNQARLRILLREASTKLSMELCNRIKEQLILYERLGFRIQLILKLIGAKRGLRDSPEVLRAREANALFVGSETKSKYCTYFIF